ncbi:MAG: hypothetical protein ACI9BO_000644 [Zhongshania sp.]|jgi:hypothetical protein
MKLSAGSIVAVVVVVVFLVFEFWQYRDAQAYRNAMSGQLLTLTVRVDSLNSKLEEAVLEMQKVEKSSIGGLIGNANDALIQGWSAMINTVEKELQRAKNDFDKKAQAPSVANPGQLQSKPVSPEQSGAGPL